MTYDMTARVKELWGYFDEILDQRIEEISKISGVPIEQFIKINPAEFIEKNKFQTIQNYQYQKIERWIDKNKTDDNTFLISPLDAIEETAAQVSYKTNMTINRTIRASKCQVLPVPVPLALDFFVRNHRQTLPVLRNTAVCFGLVYGDELVAVMVYDISKGAVRGANDNYELVRLAISKGTRVHGGASKLQKACENTLRMMGMKEIYSYSNATINSGAVYKQLGFKGSKVGEGQPFVIMKNNEIERLVSLNPYSTDEELALRGQLKTHIGGNRTWTKMI